VIGALVAVLVLGGAWWISSKRKAEPAAPPPAPVESNSTVTAPPPVTRGSTLDASGYVVARRQATVSAKTTGRVIEVSIEEGQSVQQDEIIARLDDTNTRAAQAQAKAQLAQAQASLEASKVALDDARRIYVRNEQQYGAQVISAQDFDNAKAAFNAAQSDFLVKQKAVEVARASLAIAERSQEDTIVRAPFAGVVTVKAAQPGEIVSPISAGGGFTRTGIGTIVDMASLEVEVDVNENFINRVHPGQNATIRLNAYPDWEIPAEVIAVIPTADRAKATVKVRVGFKQRDERVLPEMGARVSFLGEQS
jgi:RND family efflux transporter MFP subunit